MSFVNADQVTVFADKELPGHNNYFIGNDPSKYARLHLQGITYKNTYPNIE
jgi:hypothetical protein